MGRNGEAREKLITKAHQDVSGKNRMRFASCLFFYEHGCYAKDATALVAYYKALGLAKGTESPQKDQKRLQRAAEALAEHKASPAKRVGYDPSLWMPLVGKFVTEAVRKHPVIKYRYKIEDELLAAGLCLFTMNAFIKNRTDRMHTCGQDAQLAWYETLGADGTIKASYKSKRKRVAVQQVLQLAGLIVLRDSAFRYGGRHNGVTGKYGLGINHPRFPEFEHLYGHVVDGKSLPVVERQDIPRSLAGAETISSATDTDTITEKRSSPPDRRVA